ncbi:hypothetical protein FWH13_02000 [Candidatus Saccharibacteria bacterium]|nr:hypothetical protein [Candidatus Saccharibacteria bacterium]
MRDLPKLFLGVTAALVIAALPLSVSAESTKPDDIMPPEDNAPILDAGDFEGNSQLAQQQNNLRNQQIDLDTVPPSHNFDAPESSIVNSDEQPTTATSTTRSSLNDETSRIIWIGGAAGAGIVAVAVATIVRVARRISV